MNKYSKMESFVLGPDDGDSYWQPLPSTGYITSKFTPYNTPYDTFATGMQVLEPGASVREHAHERSHELIFVHRGRGYVEIDGERHDLEEGSMMLLGRRCQHRLCNTSDEPMKLMWVIFPPGLEDWFAAIGRKRNPGDPAPEPFERPADVEAIQDRQRFVRPDDPA